MSILEVKKKVEDKIGLNNENLVDIGNLGIFYGVGLLNFYLFSLVTDARFDEYSVGQHCAYIFGGLILGLAANRLGTRLILRYSIFITTFGIFLSGFAKCLLDNNIGDTLFYHSTDFLKFLIPSGRGIFGFGFSVGLGLSLTIIVEKFDRYKRTWATALVCAIGFFAPILGVIIVLLFKIIDFRFMVNDSSSLPIILGGFLSLLLVLTKYRIIPKEAHIRVKEQNRLLFEKKMIWHLMDYLKKGLWKDIYIFIRGLIFSINKNNQTKQPAFMFWSCSLMGISMQYFAFLMQHAQTIPFYDKLVLGTFHNSSININWIAILLRSAGVIIGTLFIAYFSKKYRQRRKIIMITQLFQFFALFLFFLPFFMDGYINKASCFVISTFIIGLTNGVWFLLLLQVAEQFSVKNRPVMMAFVPNIYRFSTIFLILLNISPIELLAKDSTIHTLSKDVLINQPYSLFIWGIVFIGLSIHGTNSIKDNFEGDPLYIDEESNKSLVDSLLKTKIDQIDKDIVVAEDSKSFLKEINVILFNHFSLKLQEHFYLNNIFYFDRHNYDELGSSLTPHEEEEAFNKSAYENYGLNIKKPTEFHIASRRLINKKLCISLSKWAADSPIVSGIILWRSAKGQELNQDERPEYRTPEEGSCYSVFDLSTIVIADKKKYFPLLKMDTPIDVASVLLDEMIQTAQFDEDNFDKVFRVDASVDVITKNKLKANILLHKLDADNYPLGSYYAYFIKPTTTIEDIKGILFIKTVVPLKRHRLGQLRDLITTVMLQRANALLKRTNEFIIDEDSHSKRHKLKVINNQIQELKIATQRLDKERALSYINKIHSLTKHIDHVADINYVLMKIHPNETIHPGDKNWDIVSNSSLNLKNELLGIIDLVDHSIDALRISEDAHKKNIRNFALPVLRENVENNIPENINIFVLPAGFRVVLTELLKNASIHTDSNKPELNIKFYRNSSGDFELHFINNLEFSIKAFDYIKYNKESNTGLIAHTRGGIRTIKRYLRFKNFNYNSPENRWQLDAENPLLSKNKLSTDIFLIIPQSDVNDS